MTSRQAPDVLPLAPSQELLWEFMTALSPADPTATREVASGSCLFEGPLDMGMFRAALEDVTRRHDALRLAFAATSGPDPSLRVAPEIDVPLQTADLCDLPPDRRGDEAMRLAATDPMTFDLTHGPLWRTRLTRLSPTEHLFSYVFCHLVADGWSCRVIVEDLVAAYRACAGSGPPVAGPAWGFEDISAWQRWLLCATPERTAFWREQLTPLPGYLPFPVTSTTPDTNIAGETAQTFRLAPEVTHGLRKVAWRARTTPYVVFMAAYHIVLARHTGSRRVVVATTTTGRGAKEALRAVGQFTNDIHVAVRLSPGATLREVLRDTSRALAAAEANAVSYRALAAAVHPGFLRERPWPDNHLFDAYMQADPPDPPDIELPGLAARWAPFDGRGTSAGRPPLAVRDVPPERLRVWAKHGCPDVIVNHSRTGGAVVYNPAFYAESFVRELVAEYTATVESIVLDPDARL